MISGAEWTLWGEYVVVGLAEVDSRDEGYGSGETHLWSKDNPLGTGTECTISAGSLQAGMPAVRHRRRGSLRRGKAILVYL
jgi:hypothetical protein